jgi:hypothetical protein
MKKNLSITSQQLNIILLAARLTTRMDFDDNYLCAVFKKSTHNIRTNEFKQFKKYVIRLIGYMDSVLSLEIESL